LTSTSVERPLSFRCFALNQRKGKIAAEQDLAGAADAVGEARRDRTDPGNRKDTKCDADDENAEAAQSTA
jgi:hypothetical protein